MHVRWDVNSHVQLHIHVWFSVAFTFPFNMPRALTYTCQVSTTPPECVKLTILQKNELSANEGHNTKRRKSMMVKWETSTDNFNSIITEHSIP